MPIIISIIIIIFLILISWTWHNMGQINKTKKVITIAILLIIIYVITLIIFNISKSNINYNRQEALQAVQNVLVFLFTLINGLIVMPFIAKILNKIHENEISEINARKNFIIILIIFVIIIIFECGYLRDTQQGILNIYNHEKEVTK